MKFVITLTPNSIPFTEIEAENREIMSAVLKDMSQSLQTKVLIPSELMYSKFRHNSNHPGYLRS